MEFSELPRTFFHGYRCKVWTLIDRLGTIINQKLFGLGVRVSDISAVSSIHVRCSDKFQAAVLKCCIFEGNPEANSWIWFCEKVRTVLMRCHFTADARVLVNVHALGNCRSLETQLPTKFPHSVIKRVFPEHWMFRVQSVSDLIQGKFFSHQKLVIFINRSSFEKVANFIARFDEILVAVLKIWEKSWIHWTVCFEIWTPTWDDSESVVEKILRSSFGAWAHKWRPAFIISATSARL